MINNFVRKSRKSQVAIFVIIAIVIVMAVVMFLFLRDKLIPGAMPSELQPVYDYYLSCIEDETKIAASMAGSQAGYVKTPEFKSGSQYMPFSSQLDFLGYGVPYWYYISGNGIAKEQVPGKEKIEQQIEDYLEERIKYCGFREFESQGYVVEFDEEPNADVNVYDNKINVEVEMPLTISFGETTARQTTHELDVDSKLGKFYNIARDIYDNERSTLFLENYGIDVLRLYAPVDGVEISCSPKIWFQDDIKAEIREALAGNIQAVKVKGDYYSLSSDERKYFVQDVRSNENVNFLYSKEWPTKIEIYPDENPLIAEPVGLEEGLGILGFCYIPWHFVYDITYPVLIQIYDGEEMFQFPVAIVIDKNKPIEGLDVEALADVVPELCEHKLTEMNVFTYDARLKPVEASISYKCFDTKCDIGYTRIQEGEAYLRDYFPQCVNGFILARSEGYGLKKYLISTVESGTANIILDKEYELNLEVSLNGEEADMAVVYFTGNDVESFTVAYPQQTTIRLTEGQYEVKVYVYENSSISFAGSKNRKCIDIPESGIFGIFGSKKEKCFDIDVPSQTISLAVAGGGEADYYFAEPELASASKLKIKASELPEPDSLEQLQDNYALLEEKTLWLEFE